jgi:hypothetical protein
MTRLALFSLILFFISYDTVRADAPLFQIEPKNRFTFSHNGNLAVGDIVHVRFTRLSPNDVFHINKCGAPCNTSKLVFLVDGKGLREGERTFEIAEEGRYYFWIQRTLDDGASGPSHIDKFEAKSTQFNAVFATGSIVSGELERRPNQ